MKYCIDTSGLTFGWRHHPRSNFPSLWNDIETTITRGLLIAPDEVLQELKRGGDDLYDWACTQYGLFIPPDPDIQSEVSAILANPDHAKLLYTQTATNLVVADPFVIATARVHGCTVISGEALMLTPSPRKNKIPNVCADLNIPHISFVEFVKQQGWSY